MYGAWKSWKCHNCHKFQYQMVHGWWFSGNAPDMQKVPVSMPVPIWHEFLLIFTYLSVIFYNVRRNQKCAAGENLQCLYHWNLRVHIRLEISDDSVVRQRFQHKYGPCLRIHIQMDCRTLKTIGFRAVFRLARPFPLELFSFTVGQAPKIWRFFSSSTPPPLR